MKQAKFHIISTGRQNPEQLAEIVGSIHSYIDAIHIRERKKTAKEIYNLISLLTAKGIPLSKIMINDRVDVAHVSNVEGVQLANQSLPADVVRRKFTNLKIGCSVHTINEAQIAQQQDADYVIFGHVFPTQSKPGLPPRGLEQLKLVSDSIAIPVLAIGGIKPENTRNIIDAGAQGIAVMSGVLEAKRPLEKVKEYYHKLSE